MVGGMWLTRVEECGRIKMSRVMILGVVNIISFRIE